MCGEDCIWGLFFLSPVGVVDVDVLAWRDTLRLVVVVARGRGSQNQGVRDNGSSTACPEDFSMAGNGGDYRGRGGWFGRGFRFVCLAWKVGERMIDSLPGA